MKSAAFLTSILLILASISCKATYQTRDDMEKARTRAAEGDPNVTPEIMQNLPTMPEEVRPAAVDTVASIPGEQSAQALRDMLEKPETSSPEMKARILDRIMQRQDPGAEGVMLAEVQETPALLTESMIRYWEKRNFTGAETVIIHAIDANQFVEPGLSALRTFGTDVSTSYLFGAAAKPDHPGRLTALRSLSSVGASRGIEKTKLVSHILSTGTEPKEVVIAALELASVSKDRMLEGQLVQMVRQEKDQDIRKLALTSLSGIRGMDSALVEQDLVMPLADIQAASAAQTANLTQNRTQPQPQPQPQPRQRNIDPGIQNPAARSNPTFVRRRIQYTDNYRESLNDYFSASMDPGEARLLTSRINNAILSYAGENSNWTAFLVNAYRKEFSGSEPELRQKLNQGLSFPGSLSAILHHVYEEYPGYEMRMYAVSRLFAIPRWQAAILLDYVQRER